ncbi:alpha/beta fold hydrolase [uncultured Dietzia sp.]|uniref:alpha/beta fold hydrolase n=1 Tax=uncultured Dietzia sp. TaxID=395519 RepID=UPI0025F0AB2E|nr:alpha/beta hydrolase [uncultured Dietzia sp.]
MDVLHHDQTPGTTRSRRGRWARRARRIAIVVAALFTVIGIGATWTFFFGAPGVGHFRSADGRNAYMDAYAEAMEALPAPTTVHDIQTDYGSIRVYEWSTAETRDRAPALLVPGRASGVPMWAENLPALVAERRVLAFDALGDSGMSEQSVPFATFADQAHPIEEVVTALAPDGVHVVGHSFGGAIAASYARQYPERTLTLSLLEPVFTVARPPAGLFFWAMVSSLPLLPDGIRETALEKIGGVEEEAAELGDDPMARMIAAATEHYQAALPQPAPLTDEELSQLTMPVYVAIASDDSLAGGVSAARRAEQLPAATAQTWPETTHSLPMQAAGVVEPVLLDFFAENEPS